jgi:hypothetical protein
MDGAKQYTGEILNPEFHICNQCASTLNVIQKEVIIHPKKTLMHDPEEKRIDRAIIGAMIFINRHRKDTQWINMNYRGGASSV